MKILIVVDLLNNWALHNRAKAIAKFMPDVQFEIRAGLNNLDVLIGHEEFDLVHFNFTYGITTFTDFIIKNNHRCLITLVNERSYYENFGVDHAQFRQIISGAKHITSVGRRLADELEIPYIPNGIDEDLFGSFKKPVVGYAGTDKENKNYAAIVQACSDLELELRKALYNSGKQDFQHQNMVDFYMGLDVYVHASLTEGFNNTVIEALSCNVPVLMTKQGSWQEFEGYVEFIEPTLESIRDGLRKYTGRQLIEKKFLWKNIVPKYRECYELIYENLNRIHQ